MFKNIDYFVLKTTTSLMFLLMMVSFVFTWAKDEGTLGKSIISNWVADAFAILKLPVSIILEHVNISSGFFPLLIFGLILNALFYGLLTERIIYFLKKRNFS